MRHYRITPTRHDMFLRWFHFDRRRAWLDRADPVCHLTLLLLGPGGATAGLRFFDRDGAVLPHEILPGAEVPPGLPDFAQAPAGQRQLVRLALRFPPAGPVTLRRVPEDRLLLTLTPEIVYPQALFELMRECRDRLCPEGFANFVETGTLLGHTTLHASYWFPRVWTIELSEALHREACAALQDRTNVTCLQGNSAAVLPGLVPRLEGASLFFLDAHWSGDDTVDWQSSLFEGYPVETARIDDPSLPEAERQVPLLSELHTITAMHRGPAVILIDDWGSIGQTDHGFRGEDWSTLDAAGLLAQIAGHPRTRFHFRADHHRYLWAIGPYAG